MPLLRTEAEKLSNRYLEAGIVEELVEKDSMFAYLPFMQVNNKTYDYIREDESAMATAIAGTSSVDWRDPNDTIPEEAMSFIEVSAKLRILAGDVDTDRFLKATMGDTNNQKAAQLAAKAKIIRSKFQNCLINGNSSTNTKQFDGLATMVSSGQTLTAGGNGATLTFDMLDELKDQVNYGADALVMHSKTWRAMKSMMRALNIQPEHVAVENVGIMVPVYDGTPILINDFVPTTETQGTASGICTSIYAARFNEADGLFGLYGGPNAGIVVEEVGLVQNKDADRTRVKWYTGCALKSTKALARLQGVRLS